jgi:hypothetical protein
MLGTIVRNSKPVGVCAIPGLKIWLQPHERHSHTTDRVRLRKGVSERAKNMQKIAFLYAQRKNYGFGIRREIGP